MDRNRGFDINALRQQLEDLFEDFFPSGGARRPSGGRGDQGQQLPVNLVESEDAFVLTAPLPGLQPEDIEINVRGQNLSLRAQRKNQPADRPNFVRREWGFGPFQRNLDLPSPVDAENASAAFRHGVVTITIPKAERARSINIEDTEGEQTEQTAQAEAPARPEEPAQAEEVAPAPSEEGENVAVTEEGDGGDARGGRSFYMPRQERGRRGRYQGPGSRSERQQEPPAAPAEPDSAVTPEMEVENAGQVMEESEAQGAESTTTGPDSAPETVSDLETPGEQAGPEAEAQAGVGSETERPQEPGAEDASPVAHTTTASGESHDLSDQSGESTEVSVDSAESGGAESVVETNEVTDIEEATKNQTTNEPTD